MPINRLTDRECRAAVCPPHLKTRKLPDGHGMYLLVKPSGAKIWRMAFRVNGRAQTASFGPYPLVSLADARRRRDEWRLLLVRRLDPRPVLRAAPAPEKAPSMTLREAMHAYWNSRESVSAGYRRNAIRGFEIHLTNLLDRPAIAQIDRAALMTELRRMDAAKLFVYVRRVRMWASLVFEWALERREESGVTSNPAKEIDPEKAFGRAPVKSFAALGPSELPAFLHRLSFEDDASQTAQACRMLALTWARTQEVRMMEWSEIEENGTLWRIPAGKMKRRTEHLVPLSRQAGAILSAMRERSGESKYVFPCESGRRPDRPMSENAILYLIGRMGYKGRMTGHGWRSVASTWANESGRYGSDAIERQLAHTPDDKVRAAYNRAAFLAERKRMLQDWADWLDAVARQAQEPQQLRAA